MKKFKSCGKCNNGYYYRQDENGEIVAIPCKCLIDYREKTQLEINIKKAELPLSIIDYDVSTSIGNTLQSNLKYFKQYIQSFKEKFYRIHLYFWSKQSSTQKTTIASWIGREILKQGYSVYFILMNDLIKLLQNGDFDSKIQAEIEKYIKCDFLIIDDSFDPDKVTLYKSKYQLSFLDTFLRKRLMQLEKATCFTSNIPIEKIGTIFSNALEKLIKRSVIVFHFPDEIDYNISMRIFED